MSILIKGLDKPSGCGDCPFHNEKPVDWVICTLTKESARIWDVGMWANQEPKCLKNCPIIEVQTPHGDLIDIDTIDFTNNDDTSWAFNMGAAWAIMQVARAKTIIESEK